MLREARWVAALDCGHDAPVPPLGVPPRPGQWVSCPVAGCRRQGRVAAVRPVPVVYVQDVLL